MGGQFVTVLILSIISSVGFLQDVTSVLYGGEKCVPFQGRDERKVCILRTGSWDWGRARVTEIRYNGEQDNYWDHSHNRETPEWSQLRYHLHHITKCQKYAK